MHFLVATIFGAFVTTFAIFALYLWAAGLLGLVKAFIDLYRSFKELFNK